jgi:uncharacterized protein YceH (UPF0502 family)
VNCSQHIVTRFSEADIERALGPEIAKLQARVAALESENARLRDRLQSAATPPA